MSERGEHGHGAAQADHVDHLRYIGDLRTGRVVGDLDPARERLAIEVRQRQLGARGQSMIVRQRGDPVLDTEGFVGEAGQVIEWREEQRDVGSTVSKVVDSVDATAEDDLDALRSWPRRVLGENR